MSVVGSSLTGESVVEISVTSSKTVSSGVEVIVSRGDVVVVTGDRDSGEGRFKGRGNKGMEREGGSVVVVVEVVAGVERIGDGMRGTDADEMVTAASILLAKVVEKEGGGGEGLESLSADVLSISLTEDEGFESRREISIVFTGLEDGGSERENGDIILGLVGGDDDSGLKIRTGPSIGIEGRFIMIGDDDGLGVGRLTIGDDSEEGLGMGGRLTMMGEDTDGVGRLLKTGEEDGVGDGADGS